MDDSIRGDSDPARTVWWTILKRVIMMTAAGVALYTVFPLLIDVFATAPRLKGIPFAWFGVMLATEAGSFVAAWGLTRLAVPGLPWRVAALSQLAANSASRLYPGGAVVGSALYYRMLSRAGIAPGNAAAALTLNSMISTMVLFTFPAIAITIAAFSAPIPQGLVPVALGGAVVFAALFVAGFIAVRFDAPLRMATRVIGAIAARMGALFHRRVDFSPDGVLARRDEVTSVVGPNWHRAVGLASANWLLDYLTLVAALYAVGARPRLSIVLLAYSASAVLTMIPITPGGLGFVEAGLAATLTLAGVPAADALLATLAYRLFSFWLPIPTGGIAYLLFRRWFGGRATSEP